MFVACCCSAALRPYLAVGPPEEAGVLGSGFGHWPRLAFEEELLHIIEVMNAAEFDGCKMGIPMERKESSLHKYTFYTDALE